MIRANIGNVMLKVVRRVAFVAMTVWSGSTFADLVPVDILLKYAPENTCESSIRAEDRRHDIELLRLRQQERAVLEKYQEHMIDCIDQPPDCAIKANKTKQAGLNAISKQRAREDKVHLDKLDEITTLCPQGNYPPRR